MPPIKKDRLKLPSALSRPLAAFLVIMFALGCFLIKLTSKGVPWEDIGKELGILFVSVTPVVLIYELILRLVMHNEMAKTTTEAVKKSLPDSYKNIMKYGITDLYDGLSAGTLRENLELAPAKSEITVNNIYIPDFKFGFKYKTIFIDALVQKKSNLKILLCDFDATELLEKRAKSTAFSSLAEYQQGIRNNLNFIHSIWRELADANLRDKISVRLHNDFVSISSWGFGDFYIIGNYLFGRSAVQGVQIKVKRDTLDGPSELFTDLDQSFQLQWKSAYKQVNFSEDDYTIEPRSPEQT
jgi:hypothetical protein